MPACPKVRPSGLLFAASSRSFAVLNFEFGPTAMVKTFSNTWQMYSNESAV